MKTKSRTAIFPGSFDPFTYGHMNILERASRLFDEVIVAVSSSNSKTYVLSSKQRVQLIEEQISGLKNVSVKLNDGLTVAFAKKNHASFLIRSLRSGSDFDHERPIADANKRLDKNIETVFLIADPVYSCISSTLVREIAKNDGNISEFVALTSAKALRKAMK